MSSADGSTADATARAVFASCAESETAEDEDEDEDETVGMAPESDATLPRRVPTEALAAITSLRSDFDFLAAVLISVFVAVV